MYEQLALAAASGVVGAMATESWTWMRSAAARLLGRGGPDDAVGATGTTGEVQALEVLDDALDRVGRGGEDEAETVRAELAARLRTLLAEHPDLVPQVDDLVRQAAARGLGGTVVVQHVSASGQAQQAVLGKGEQHNTFGSRPER